MKPIDPYAPPTSISDAIDQPRKGLTGFARGARNGALWSLTITVPVVCLLVTGEKYRLERAILETWFIPTIWILSAGLVASIIDRQSPPDSKQKSVD